MSRSHFSPEQSRVSACHQVLSCRVLRLGGVLAAFVIVAGSATAAQKPAAAKGTKPATVVGKTTGPAPAKPVTIVGKTTEVAIPGGGTVKMVTVGTQPDCTPVSAPAPRLDWGDPSFKYSGALAPKGDMKKACDKGIKQKVGDWVKDNAKGVVANAPVRVNVYTDEKGNVLGFSQWDPNALPPPAAGVFNPVPEDPNFKQFKARFKFEIEVQFPAARGLFG